MVGGNSRPALPPTGGELRKEGMWKGNVPITKGYTTGRERGKGCTDDAASGEDESNQRETGTLEQRREAL